MCERKFVNKMAEDIIVNRTNTTVDTNETFDEINNASLPGKAIKESLFLSDSASIIGIFIAVAVVLITVGELTYAGLSTISVLRRNAL